MVRLAVQRVEESFSQFLEQMWPYLSEVDRLRLMSRRDAS